MMRTLGLLASLLIVAAAPPPPVPAAQPFAIGTLKAWALRDNARAVPNDGSLFPGTPTAEIAKLLTAAGLSGDVIPLSFDAVLVRLPGHVVLFDTGLGPKTHGVLIQSLAEAGVAPGEVTDIFLTHSHPDHVGGLIGPDGKPAFPRAKVRMAAAEWAFMQANAQEAALSAAIAPQVVPFVPGGEPVPGVRTIALVGHTPGHTGYRIGAGKDALFDIGDSAHSSVVSLARPGWTIAYDQDDAAGKGSREAVLAKVAASGTLVFAPHFPFPGVGHIVRAGAGYAWVPAPLR